MKVSVIFVFFLSITVAVLVTIPDFSKKRPSANTNGNKGPLAGLKVGDHQALNFAYNPMGLEQQRLNGQVTKLIMLYLNNFIIILH